MDCIFSVYEKEKEIERIVQCLNDDKNLISSIAVFISNECGLPDSSCLYGRDSCIKKDSIINYFSTLYDDNLPYMKKKKDTMQKVWEKNKYEINEKLKNIWKKYLFNENYEIRLNLSRSPINNLDDNIYDVCYKLTKQALLEECIYFACLKCFNNFFNEKLSEYNSIKYKKLKILFGQILVNILFRSELLNKYRTRYPKDQYLLNIKCNKKQLLEIAFDIFCNNSFESSLLLIWDTILNNYENISNQINKILL